MHNTLPYKLFIACALIASCSVSPYTEGPDLGANPSLLPLDYQAEIDNGQFFIGPEDKLSIDFWKQADLTRSYSVRNDGHVLFPLVGRMQAVGLTREAFEDNLIEAYSDYIVDPVLALSVEFYPSRKVTVLGQVNTRSVVSLSTPNTTILDVIATAGGLTDDGDTSGVLIARRVNGVMDVRHYSLDGLFAPSDINMRSSVPYVQSGDIVYVLNSPAAEYAEKLDMVSDTLRAANYATRAISGSDAAFEVIVGD
ncbi:MAG: polysaccharide biosynthesis/export family protein [Planctomycetota bacterium]|jgi:polysaccharide export outer membrane protein|nr:polysaccharide biosynthesis/export family protein [Planctomycetota bacterium]